MGTGRVSQGGRQEGEGTENGMQMRNQELLREEGRPGGRESDRGRTPLRLAGGRLCQTG